MLHSPLSSIFLYWVGHIILSTLSIVAPSAWNDPTPDIHLNNAFISLQALLKRLIFNDTQLTILFNTPNYPLTSDNPESPYHGQFFPSFFFFSPSFYLVLITSQGW